MTGLIDDHPDDRPHFPRQIDRRVASDHKRTHHHAAAPRQSLLHQEGIFVAPRLQDGPERTRDAVRLTDLNPNCNNPTVVCVYDPMIAESALTVQDINLKRSLIHSALLFSVGDRKTAGCGCGDPDGREAGGVLLRQLGRLPEGHGQVRRHQHQPVPLHASHLRLRRTLQGGHHPALRQVPGPGKR